jgi:hypothetical protein
MLDLVDLAASGLDSETNAIWVQCKGAPVSDDEAPDYGQAPFMCSLGLSARPAPADDSGNAQGVVAAVAGIDGVCIGGFDPRSTEVFGELKPGETALHATGKGFDSRVLCKDKMIACVVSDDMAFVMDRKKNQISEACGGYARKVSEEDGWLFLDKSGSAGIQIKDGVVTIFGTVVLGGRMAGFAVAQVPPTVGLPATGPLVPVPAAPGVFIGV